MDEHADGRAPRPAPLRIAHRGYRTIAAENSLAQIGHAVALGCDVVEVDVRRRRDGALVLDHDDAEREGAPLLADALALVAQASPTTRLNLDLKVSDLADPLLAALAATGMVERTTCTGGAWEALAALRAREPRLAIGLTVPRRSGLPQLPGLHRLAAWATRPRLARELGAILDAHGADLVTVHWRLVDRRVVDAVHAAGGRIWVWTVDDRRLLRRLEALGVDGITSNLPESHGLVAR